MSHAYDTPKRCVSGAEFQCWNVSATCASVYKAAIVYSIFILQLNMQFISIAFLLSAVLALPWGIPPNIADRTEQGYNAGWVAATTV